MERIQYWDPGELGKLVGLDRVPEVSVLRKKVGVMAEHGDIEKWSKELAMYWMEENPEKAGTLYIDGHVRVYHGKQTKLPKRYVAREKLCLRGVTDYWINDVIGQPFFVISKEVNEGILKVMQDEIVPVLLKDIPNQPTKKLLDDNPYLYRFMLVFDREGYSPVFFKKMWKENRIACITYKKYAEKEWAKEEFKEFDVEYPNGEKGKMNLAERGIYLKSGDIWVREVRKLSEAGHQTSLITTDYSSEISRIAPLMFSRWSQENFFKYMMEHYGIDRLADYQLENMPETIHVINPLYRELESKIRSLNSKLSRREAKYGALVIDSDIREDKIKQYARQKSELGEEIKEIKIEIAKLKVQKKGVKKHISLNELPEGEKFRRFKRGKKQFLDTLKMIAYRAETSIVNFLCEHIPKKDETRSIVRQIFETDADIEPNENNGTLTVRLHNLTNPRYNKYAMTLCNHLNDASVHFPGTNLRLVYNLVSCENLRNKDV